MLVEIIAVKQVCEETLVVILGGLLGFVWGFLKKILLNFRLEWLSPCKRL